MINFTIISPLKIVLLTSNRRTHSANSATTGQKLVAGCSQKCLGYVKCNGAACPDWEGTACFYLGSSNNWKVCTSASCKARGSSAPVPKGADDPSPGDGNSATCVYGKYVWNSGNSKFQQANGVTALNSGNRCNQGANAQCQSNADCAGCVLLLLCGRNERLEGGGSGKGWVRVALKRAFTDKKNI
jgi:hypothetical protein